MLHVLNIIKGMCHKLVLENGMYIFKVASLHITDTGTSKRRRLVYGGFHKDHVHSSHRVGQHIQEYLI